MLRLKAGNTDKRTALSRRPTARGADDVGSETILRAGELRGARRFEAGSLGSVERSTTEVQAVRGLSPFQELRAEWAAIDNPWASPMQSHDWVRTWAEVYGTDRDLEILSAGRHPAAAIAPLVRSRRGGQRLELAGPDELGEVMDFLYSDSSAVGEITRAIVHSGTPLRFWRVPADSPVVGAVKNAYRGRGIVRCQPSAGVPSLPLDESWIDPERHLDKRRRSNLRRARRIAEGMGPVTAEILAPKPDEVGPLLDEAYALEEAGWKGRSGTPLARAPLTGEFFRRYATAAAKEGVLRLSFLRIGSRAAAMKLATITGNRFWLLAMGFSEEFEECSPGTLLLMETIRYAARLGLRSYEFLGGDEPWIRPWTQLLRPCVSLRTYPFSSQGVVALASDAGALVGARIKSIASTVPRAARALERHNALAYVAGPKLEDAVRACRSLNERGLRTTIGYVTGPNDTPRTVARRYSTTIDAIADDRIDCYVSVKAPELRFSRDLFRDIADHAHARGVRLHFDAMGAGDVDETFTLINELRSRHPDIGCTLPGRWTRSAADADRAIDLNLGVRIVKGEWADRREREVEPRAGSLAILDRIAGRVRDVAVGTHDPWLARVALRRLRTAGTPCELEVLMGYPFQRVLPSAKAEGVPVRMYVPYGNLSPPYSLSQVTKKPRIAAWTIRDLYRIAKSRTSRSSGVTDGDPDQRSDASGNSIGSES